MIMITCGTLKILCDFIAATNYYLSVVGYSSSTLHPALVVL